MKLMDSNGQVKHGDARKKKILFEPFKRTHVIPRTVLIVGGPGSGKTTLCRKIAYDWAGQGKTFPEFSSDDAVVLYLDMSRLGKDVNLEDELLKLATQDGGTEEDEMGIFDTSELLKSYDRNVIVVLDGYVGIDEKLKVQIRDLAKSRPNSTFKAASIVVTSRPGVDDETNLLFHKHFFLKGFSVGLAQKLMFKYYQRSSSTLGAYYQGVLNRFQMKNLTPLVILAMCNCEVNTDSGLKENEVFRLLAMKLGKHCNVRNRFGLTDKQVEDKIERLGRFFWKCLCKKQYTFKRPELDIGLQDDLEFVLASGLLRTKDDFKTWEPVNAALRLSLSTFHLEKRWIHCLNCDNIPCFLTSFFPKLPSLQVSCCVKQRSSDVTFRVMFDYKDFKIMFTISDGESKLHVINRLSDATPDNDCDELVIAYRYQLKNKDNSESIVNNLRRMFSNEKSLSCLTQFISHVQSAEVLFTTRVLSSSSTPLGPYPLELQPYDALDINLPHPFQVLTTLCQEVRVTFVKSACTSLFVRSVLECIFGINSDNLKCQNEYHVLESLKTASLKPPFACAHIYGSKTMFYSHFKCARVINGSQLQSLCDRLELVFRTNDTFEHSTNVTSFL